MDFKNNLGRWVLGIGGALGIAHEIPTETSPTQIEPTDSIKNESLETTPSQATDPEETDNTPDAPISNTQHSKKIDTVLQDIDALQKELPPLKNIPEQPSVKPAELDIHPFLSLDHAKAYVTHIIDGVSKRCVDKITHLIPDLLPEGTIGMTVTDTSTPEEQMYRIRLDQVVTGDSAEKSWQEFYEMTFHPKTETTEITPEHNLQDIISPITITGDSPSLEEQIKAYEEAITLAKIYLQAGMTRMEVKQRIEEKLKKSSGAGSLPDRQAGSHTGKDKK